ncbi:MAG: cobalt transporter [Candidatus Faecousia sp.]|nr:cobalt transporter [Clostridiales bacterium]MDY6179623.1 cobalt transporter [Candidatus Faecousia sp.]
MHLDHDHVGAHDHEHTHSHTHEHTHDGVTHTHAHEHVHEHDHVHPHDHAELHAEGQEHTHSHDCGHGCGSCTTPCEHTPMEELTALMKYMVGHNAAHAKELADLAQQLEKAGSHTAYEQVMAAVSDFEKGNMRLSVVLQSLDIH